MVRRRKIYEEKNCDIKKIKFYKTKENSNCDKLKNSNCDKTQIGRKFKNSNCDEPQKLKFLSNLRFKEKKTQQLKL